MTPDQAAREKLNQAAREKLIVALDFPRVAEAEALVERLGDTVVFYKIGLGLQLGGGDALARKLLRQGKRVFLDYKYFDIGETLRNAVARAADLGVDFLTVHGSGGILRDAVAGRGASKLKLFCVTVLTSLDAADIADMGFPCAVEDLVLHRALRAAEAGCDGVIASAREAERIRAKAGAAFLITTPGIRQGDAPADDQKRAATPAEAIRAGADYLVVGRPIHRAPDPVAAAEAIVAEMAGAL